MTGRSRYAATSVALVALTAAIFWPVLAPSGRATLLAVGVLAVVLQGLLFSMLSAAHGDADRFMKSWALGMAGRLTFVAVVGLVVTTAGIGDATVAVIAAAAFVFALHLIEPVFLGTSNRNEYAR